MAAIVCPLEAAEKENPLVRAAHYLEDWARPVPQADKPLTVKSRIEKPQTQKEGGLVGMARYLEDWARPASRQEKKRPTRAEPAIVQTVAPSVPQDPDWSIIIYDDTELKTAGAQQFFSIPIPENIELLVGSPAGTSAQRSRVISRPALHGETLFTPSTLSLSERLTRFLVWAKDNAHGKYTFLIITAPAPGDAPALAHSLGTAARDASFQADAAFVNISGLGDNVLIGELKETGRYLIVSENAVPAGGVPMARLFSMMRRPTILPLEFAKVFPRTYVEEYAHDGSMAIAEGGYYPVGLAAIDTAKLSAALDAIKKSPGGEGVALLAGYPKAIADENAFSITLEPDNVRSFEARIEAYPHGDREKVLADERRYWIESNKDLALPDTLVYDAKDIGTAEQLRREFVVKGDVKERLTFRPWLPGAQYIILTTVDGSGRTAVRHYTRDKDYFSVESFPETSFLVSEAHSQGASFGRGSTTKVKSE